MDNGLGIVKVLQRMIWENSSCPGNKLEVIFSKQQKMYAKL